MGATSAGVAKAESGEAEQAKLARPGAIRDIRLDGHLAGRGGRATLARIDAVELRLDDPEVDADLNLAFEYWQQKRGGRLAPTRADIDPVDIAPLLPRVTLVDVSTDPIDFRFRLAGTGLFKIHGAELTNKRALDLNPPAYGALLHRLYCDALARRAPIAHRLLIECATRRSAYMRIILPLSEDNQAISRLMTVESYADAAQELRDCFEEARLSSGGS
ncbi:PAS domain-containing protein [Dongia sedimenti]|uniref:PAS domain-containing protein n=1 Tax=Dongia sedimenti TaxID=3064282 RepID=A0ABU0YLW7_9PROT|nr:PAS domain-containing protein [Rhodospirillaceae bacterium R-7]